MKIVFNYWLFLLLGVVTLAEMPPANAQATYFTTAEVLTDFFPKSDKVNFTDFTPTVEQRATLKAQLGYELPRKTYHFFVATTGDMVDGYAFVDNEMGQHKPITFAVMLSQAGVVLREEVMVYRETRGDEIRSSRFRRQFKGKTIRDRLKLDSDIDSISGATISARAITTGVRRALVLFDHAVTPSQLRVSQAGLK